MSIQRSYQDFVKGGSVNNISQQFIQSLKYDICI